MYKINSLIKTNSLADQPIKDLKQKDEGKRSVAYSPQNKVRDSGKRSAPKL